MRPLARSVPRGRILVVDDEECIRYTFRSFLEDEGHATFTAESYEEAMALLREEPFDLVFVDIILGDRSGVELLRDFRDESPDTDVIVITGAPSVETAAESVRLGALDYLVKPVRQAALIRTTDWALEHRALLRAEERHHLDLEAIFRSVRDAIITVDADMRVVEINPAGASLCGLDREGATGRPLRSLPLRCSGVCFEALRDTLRSARRVDLPCVECAVVGRPEQLVSLTATPLLRPDGRPSGGVLVVRDETRLVALERSVSETRQLGRIVGRSPPILEVVSLVEALADVSTSVLISGESGTGKELVADALHAAGPRRDKNLVKINCGALPQGLLESELFGHVRGAFTGAVRDKVGRFQRADGGTIFFDEVGEMPPSMQLRLLRVLEAMEFERVGDSTPVRVDVRVIAATNRDLARRVREGTFREDLYFRLKVVEIEVPPLRERRGDIPLLVDHFVARFNDKLSATIKGVSDAVMERFMRYHWPGNIRELEHVLEHAFVLGRRRSLITPAELPHDFMPAAAAYPDPGKGSEAAEVGAIQEALRQASFNKTEAARLLGMSRRTFYRKLKLHGLEG